MIGTSRRLTVFAYARAVDMRKSFNGLAGLVREQLQADPMSRHLFLFCNRDRNRLKVLVADESGMWLLSQRLDRGTVTWSAAAVHGREVEYRAEQLALLLSGFDAERLSARRWRRRAASAG